MTDPLDVIVEVAHIQRLPFGLAIQPRPPIDAMDGPAFDTALGVFHRVYAHSQPRTAEEHEEAVREALESFLGTYMELRA